MGNIYYLIPDIHKPDFSFVGFYRAVRDGEFKHYWRHNVFVEHKPVGGIKVMYQHCLLLRELGYEAYPLVMGKYIGNFFGYDIEIKHIDDIGFVLSKEDVIVAPEFLPYLGLSFQNATKVVFNQSQSWRYLHNRLINEDAEKSFIDLGYDHVINCSQYLCDKLKENMGIESYLITNGIDTSRFIPMPEKRVNKRVLALSRKRPENLEKIRALLDDLDFEYHFVDGLAESELIQEYQQADIFIATGYPEGFSLPPLEAMNCGCVVVGFTGGGASEFMLHEETALVAEDGDCEGLAEQLALIHSDLALKEHIRRQGMDKAATYTLDNTKRMLKQFYEQLC